MLEITQLNTWGIFPAKTHNMQISTQNPDLQGGPATMALRNREKAGIQTLRNYSVTRHLTESGVSVAQYLSADFSTIIGKVI